jgi:hypothetical protein
MQTTLTNVIPYVKALFQHAFEQSMELMEYYMYLIFVLYIPST